MKIKNALPVKEEGRFNRWKKGYEPNKLVTTGDTKLRFNTVGNNVMTRGNTNIAFPIEEVMNISIKIYSCECGERKNIFYKKRRAWHLEESKKVDVVVERSFHECPVV
jgi:hypothetical protein